MPPLPSKLSDAIIPILALQDEIAGIQLMEQVFGFRVEGTSIGIGTILALGDQRILVAPQTTIIGSVQAHHLALSVPDVDVAMRECIARGGNLAKSMTPDGPLEISEFWSGGVHYVFFDGPEGALIEFCMKKHESRVTNWGHDHIGVLCTDLDLNDTQEKFEASGCNIVAEHTLHRPDGNTQVSFLRRGESVVELFHLRLQFKLRKPAKPHVSIGIQY